jgi:hypothetical protein
LVGSSPRRACILGLEEIQPGSEPLVTCSDLVIVIGRLPSHIIGGAGFLDQSQLTETEDHMTPSSGRYRAWWMRSHNDHPGRDQIILAGDPEPGQS